MGRIARESIEEVRQANDIVELVSQYVLLQKRGTGYWACCPFHDEKTPSFQVSATRQTFKCFGCGVFGNSVSFLMQHQKLDFREAVERLAEKASITLVYEGGGPTTAERSLRARALGVMGWAQSCFREALKNCAPALEYLKERGLDGKVAEEWGIGFAIDDWSALTEAARKQFGDAEALEATGLSRRNEQGRWYDFFRGRVTFPIRDTQGRVVGFGARLLDPEAKSQKYVNSAEGLLFHKSKLLYGIERLAGSKRLKETGTVLLMEGYTDVIAAHEAGFDNAVAPLGTAVTPDQLLLLRRYCDRVILVLDGDAAGLAAAERALRAVLETGTDASVAVLPEGVDPFDYLRRKGADEFEKLLGEAKDAFQFKLSTLAARLDLTRPVESEAALRELAELIAGAGSESLRELLAKRVAAALGVRERNVMAAVSAATRPAIDRQQGEDDAGDGVGLGEMQRLRLELERGLLGRVFSHPQALAAVGESVTPEMFSSPILASVYREMLNQWDEHGELVAGALWNDLDDRARAELDRVLAAAPEGETQDGGEPAAGEDEGDLAALVGDLKRLGSSKESGPAPARGSSEELRMLKEKKRRPAAH